MTLEDTNADELRLLGFLPALEFSVQNLYEVLESFRGSDCDILFDDPKLYRQRRRQALQDRLIIPSSQSTPTRNTMPPAAVHRTGNRWGVCIDTTMDRSRRAWFIQHAIHNYRKRTRDELDH